MDTDVQNGGEVLPPAFMLCLRSCNCAQSAIIIPHHCTSSWYKSSVGSLHITNALRYCGRVNSVGDSFVETCWASSDKAVAGMLSFYEYDILHINIIEMTSFELW